MARLGESAPKISVILTTHNYGRFLATSIESVLRQSCQEFELIVVDDGSTDETEEILARHSADLRVRILRAGGIGLAAACNLGIREARGEYVIRLDADDYFDPHVLLVEKEILDQHPDIGLVYSDYWRVDEQGRLLGYHRVPRAQEGEVLGDAIPLAAGAMYRRCCWETLGGYDERLRYQEDYDFWLRFTARFQVYGVGLPLMFYRQHPGSMSRNAAPRSAARRYVKRRFLEVRDQQGGAKGGGTLVVVDTTVLDPGHDPEILCADLAGEPVLLHTLRQAQVLPGLAGIVVITAHQGVAALAERFGARVMDSASLSLEAGAGLLPEADWLRSVLERFVAEGAAEPEAVVWVSPCWPLRHAERIGEALDTLRVHDLDVVVSVESGAVRSWPVSPGETVAPGTLWAEPRIGRREAGGILGATAAWLRQDMPRRGSRIGCLELLPHECLQVRDPSSLRLANLILEEGLIPMLAEAAYLREDSERG